MIGLDTKDVAGTISGMFVICNIVTQRLNSLADLDLKVEAVEVLRVKDHPVIEVSVSGGKPGDMDLEMEIGVAIEKRIGRDPLIKVRLV